MIASSVLNTQRTKKTDKVWTAYDMGLGLKRLEIQEVKKPITKDEWSDYKSMLRACGKPVSSSSSEIKSV